MIKELDRYLAGECTSEEGELVRAWAAENLENRAALEVLAEAGEGAGAVVDVDAAFERLRGSRVVEAKDPARSYGSLGRWTAGIGALTAAVLIAFYSIGISGTNKQNNYTTYTTRAGQRASLTLSNGSHVTLGPATTLRVRKNGGTAVEITGEALFNVAHAASSPFTVTAHGVTTRVLGTEFIVRAYDASLVRVAVRDGRVSANAAIVNAGEGVSIMPNTVPMVAPITDMATEFAWANGELVLRGIALSEAFVRLSRWYGMEFRVTDSNLLDAKISGVFPGSFSQTNMDVLATAIKAKATRSANVITFSTAP